jgi:tripartite ATP-independent transporter DctM subunit
MSGIIPGIAMILVFIVIISIRCARNPALGPKADPVPFQEKLRLTKGIIPVVILFVVVLGGIYTGIFSTTESGAVGSFGAIIITLVSKTINGKKFLLAVKETAMTMGMIFGLLLGTYIFIRFVAYSKIPFAFSELMVGLDLPMPMLMLILCIIYIVLGCLIPEIPILLLTVPILYPALIAIGFDPIWLGIYIVLMMALGAVTPPIGMVVFIVAGLSGVSVPKLFKAVVPFIIGDLVVIFLMCVFPAMATWLPSMMQGG